MEVEVDLDHLVDRSGGCALGVVCGLEVTDDGSAVRQPAQNDDGEALQRGANFEHVGSFGRSECADPEPAALGGLDQALLLELP